MKNRKIITLTVAIVAVTLVSILGLSKMFETLWQQKNTVDNNLSAEIVDDIETVFNYPYFNIEEYEKITDKEILERYNAEINSYKFNINEDFQQNIMRRYDTEPTDEMVTYQDVANICGNTLKYIYGITLHSTYPTCVSYYYEVNKNVDNATYCYCLIFEDKYIFMTVDPYTGNVTSISVNGFLVIEHNDNFDMLKGKSNITEDERIVLFQQIENDMSIINSEKVIKEINVMDYDIETDSIRIYLQLDFTDETRGIMYYKTVDFQYFELDNFSIITN